MQTLRIFISSPGDVAEERQITGKVIERIQGKYWSFVRLDDVFWERKVIRSTAHYQDELINPGDCEMVLGILWSRLGSPLPEKFRKQTGERYESGTEWELEMAFDAYEKSLALTGDTVTAKPDIIIYRRRAARPIDENAEEDTRIAEQARKLDAYLKENYWFPDGTIKRPITGYSNLDEFEKKLTLDLEQLVLRHIPSLKPGFEPPPISGSPFKGLQAFEFKDNDRYFGRNREIREIQHQLIASAQKGLPFILIYGGSGYGKSSLMRAGLAPVITRPGGSLDEIQGWRRVPFQPAKGDGTLCERLARSLLQSPTPAEAALSRDHDHWPLIGLPEITNPTPSGLAWDAASLARHFSSDESREMAAKAVVATLDNLNRHLFLEIDQLEEIFTYPSFDDLQRSAFLRIIIELCLSGRVWVVATMRSEFFPRVSEQPELFELVGKERGYILPPPDRQSLREIIRYPALAARLDYERRVNEIEISGEMAKHDYLHEQILADAENSPDALPLLEFTLQELYEKRDSTQNLLRWASYADAGGLKGAIAKRATKVYRSLRPTAQEARHKIFSALVHIDPAKGTITRKRAPLDSLKANKQAQEFLKAFLEAHLLITDEDSAAKEPVVTLAHEALITHWGELASWIQDHNGDILARQRLAEQTRLWLENGKKKSYLLSEARLAEAERVAYGSFFTLTAEEVSYIQLSRQRARRRTNVLKTAVAMFAVLALFAAAAGYKAKLSAEEAALQAKRAQDETKRAESALQETTRQLERSHLEEGKAWLERANTAKARGENLKALMFAGRAVGFHGFGRQVDENSALRERYQDLLGIRMLDPKHERDRNLDSQKAQSLISSVKPSCLPIWSSPIQAHYDGNIRSVVFSPDGSRIASGSDDHKVKIWDAESGEQLTTLHGHSENVLAVAFSPDGSRLASGSDDSTVKLWDLSSGKELTTLKGHFGKVASVAFSRDGRRLASGAWDNTVKLWDVTSGKEVATFAGHEHSVTSVAFNQDGNRIASASLDNTIKIWDTASAKETATLKGHSNWVSSVAFSPNGNHLASGSMDKTIKLWDAGDGKEVATLKGHLDGVTCLAFSPDGTSIASAAYDESNSIKLWDAVSRKEITTFQGHSRPIVSVAFSPNGRRLASGSGDNTIKLWDVASGTELAPVRAHSHSVKSVAFSPDGSRIASGSSDKTIKLWDASAGKELGTLNGHSNVVNDVTFSPEGRLVASGSSDKTIKLWHALTGKEIGTLLGHSESVTCVAFSPDGGHLASGSLDGSIKLWELTSRKEFDIPGGHSDVVTKITFSPDGSRLVSGSGDHTIKIWEVAGGKLLYTLTGHSDLVTSIAISPDGKQITSGSSDNTIRFWDLDNGNQVKTIQVQSAIFTPIVLSPDGSLVAFGSDDNQIKLIDASSGKEIASISGHSAVVTSLTFSPYHGHLISASDDETIKLWDVANGTEIEKLTGHSHFVNSVAFSPDGSRIASAAVDRMVKIWDVASGKELTNLRGHSNSVVRVVFSHDGSRLASGSMDKTIKLWDSLTGMEIATLTGHVEGVTNVAFSPDGSRIASGSEDRTVKLWNLSSGKEIATLNGHSYFGISMAFSADGSRLATGLDDSTVKLWDAGTGKELTTLKGHSFHVTNLAFSPDGRYIASGSRDYIIKLWDAFSGKELATLRGHTDDINSVAFSPDGNHIASISNKNKIIKLWDVATGTEITGKPQFPLGPEFSRPDGKIAALAEDSVIRLFEYTKQLPLLDLDRKGYLRIEDREVVWTTNSSLLETREFEPIHWRSDLPAQIFRSENDTKRFILRLRLCGHIGQWRALSTLWEEICDAKLDTNGEVRHEFCIQAAIALRKLALQVPAQAPEQLWELLMNNCLAEDWQDPRFSLPMREAFAALSAMADTPADLTQGVMLKCISIASMNWLEAVANHVAKLSKNETIATTGKTNLIRFLQASAASRPESLALLRIALVTYPATDPEWLRLVNLIHTHQDAKLSDFTDAAYAAAKEPTLASLARELLERTEVRFLGSEEAHKLAGWCYINLNDPAAALKSFLASRASPIPEDEPDTNLLAGLALAQWLTRYRDEAIATYKQLIEAGRAEENPTNWADPATITELNWPKTETVPLEALRAATLERHPELAPGKFENSSD